MPRSPVLLGLLAAALFGAATPASKRLLAELAPLQLSGLLYLGAALGTAPVAFRRGGRLALPGDRANRLRLAGAVALGGVLGPLLLLLGLRAAPAASVALWLNLELAATAILGALFFRDPLGRSGAIGALGVVAAAGVLAGGASSAGWSAAALVAAACVCWALDNHWTALLDGVPAATSTFWKGLAAGACSLSLGLLAAPWSAPPAATAAALGVGALCYGASISLYVSAAQGVGATRAQLLFACAPFFGVALSVAWLGESLGAAQLAAAALLIASLALVLRERHAHHHEHAALAHVHLHSHGDGHHLHAHATPAASGWHSHWHEHPPIAHSHPHWPDLHHRHGH
jgi:drug/metabolite transporter (DMT)-like permease